MKRQTRVILFSISFLLVGGMAGLFFYVRTLLPEIPHKIAQALKEKQIDFKFKEVKLESWKLNATVIAPEFSGPGIPYLVSGESLNLSVSTKGISSIRIKVEAKSPKIDSNPDYVTVEKPSSPAAPPMHVPAYLAAVLKATTLEIAATNANASPWNIQGLNLVVALQNFGWSGGSDFTAKVSHSVSLAGITDKPLIPKVSWEGTTAVAYPSLGLESHTIYVGPIPVFLKGRVDLKSLHWNLNVQVPSGSDLTKIAAAGALPPSIRSLSGKFSLSGEGQGIGADMALVQGKASVGMESIIVNLKHPSIDGPMTIDGMLDFAGGEAPSATGKLKIDLTAALVRQEKQFEKLPGVPFSFSSELSISSSKATLSNASLVLSNLNMRARGSSPLKPPYIGSFWADISPMELTGWEKFFPAHASLHTEGTLSGNVDYKGNFQEWKTADISLDLLARKVKIPILKDWLPSGGSQISGLLLLDSQTKLSLGQGEIRSLATNSNIDLTQSQVIHGQQFHKPAGKTLSANLLIKSNGKRAVIERGLLRLSNTSLTTKGVVDNFARPSVKLSFQSSSIQALDLLSMASKDILPVGLSNLFGQFSIQGMVTGPLLDKIRPPQIAGNLALTNFGFRYQKPESKQIIDLRQLSGKTSFTNDSIAGTGIRYGFPGTVGTLDLAVNHFNNPKITFRFSADRFQIRDFVPPPPKTPPVSPVPALASNTTKGAGKGADPRDNPYAKKVELNGSIQLRNADLGSLKAENLDASIRYNNLKLSVAPLTIKTFGGTIISKTYWDGNPKLPLTKQELETQGVDANQLISTFSENGKDVLTGKLFSSMVISTEGIDADAMKNALKASGSFELKDGKLTSIRLTKGPMEGLKSLPLIGAKIQKTDWDESIQSAKGTFKVENGKLLLSGLDIRTPIFEAITPNATLSVDKQLAANTTLYPNDKMFAPDTLEILKDSAGRPSLPLSISGDIKSPKVTLDSDAVQGRVKAYIGRRAEEEKQRALSSAKEKAKQAVESSVKGQINNLFKPR